MEFRALGPLEIVADGTVTRPRGVEARLLAMLLLDAGRSVSLARLVEGVWDGEPPATATRQVSNTISVLRRKHGSERIHRVGDGFTLDPSAVTVDWLRFEELVRTARVTRDHDPATALARLREALDLWRGPALADLPGRVIESGARSLDESRLAALEDRFDLELDAGESDEVARRVRRLLTDHPYRQRLTAQLMLALHRQQRTPEALAVYEQQRSRLAEDLGLEPGEPLRLLHTAVLRADPSLMITVAETTPIAVTTRPTPAQLPVSPNGFTGRATPLALLGDALNGTSRSAILTGAAGTGKTALAVHWAHRVRERFPDGQLFVNLRGFDHGEPVAPAEALGRFIRAIQGPDTPIPSDVDEAVALYRTVVDGKRVLVVLDNARDAAQVRPLLPCTSGSFAVITSRHRLRSLTAMNASAPIEVPALTDTESAELLATAVDLAEAEPATVARLAELCGHLPLALRIAAAQLATRPNDIGLLVSDLDGPRRLDALSLDGDPEATVATALERSYEALDSDARELFLALGVLPGEDYARELVTTVSRFDRNATRQALDRLETLHLLEQHHPGRYRFHDLTRLYVVANARQHLSEEQVESILDCFIDWHEADVGNVDAGFGEDVNVFRAGLQLRHHPRLWQLIYATVARGSNVGNRLNDSRELIELALSNARRHRDLTGEITMNSALAGHRWASGDFNASVELARSTIALTDSPAAAAVRARDGSLRSRLLRNLAVFLRSAGAITEAETAIRESLAHMPEMPSLAENIGPWLVLVRILRDLGQFREARQILTRTRTNTDDGASPEMDIMVRSLESTVGLDQGLLDVARDHLRPMAAIAERTGNPRHAAEVHHIRSMLYQAKGDNAAAQQEYRRTLRLTRSIGRPTIQTELLCELAKLSAKDEKPDQAHELLANAAALDFPGRTAPEPTAALALARGIVHLAEGEHDFSRAACQEAVDLNAAMPRPLHHARALTALADAHDGLGEPDTAQRLRREAQEILTRLKISATTDEAHRRTRRPAS